MKNINPASRLLQFAEATQKIKTNPNGRDSRAIHYWPQVIEKVSGQDSWDEDGVSRFLLSASDQIDYLSDHLEQKEVPQRLFQHELKNLKSMLAGSLFSNSWNEVQGKINVHTLNCLEWASIYLGDEEDEIPSEDLVELLTLLAQLEKTLSSEGLPPSLRRALLKHTTAIRTAIESYPITGAEGIQTAVEKSIGSLRTTESVLAEAVNSGDEAQIGAVGKLKSVLQKTGQILDIASKTTKSVETIASAGAQIWKMITN